MDWCNLQSRNGGQSGSFSTVKQSLGVRGRGQSHGVLSVSRFHSTLPTLHLRLAWLSFPSVWVDSGMKRLVHVSFCSLQSPTSPRPGLLMKYICSSVLLKIGQLMGGGACRTGLHRHRLDQMSAVIISNMHRLVPQAQGSLPLAYCHMLCTVPEAEDKVHLEHVERTSNADCTGGGGWAGRGDNSTPKRQG